MDRLPTEVIFEVCQNLDFFDDIAAFRLQGRRYADVGAESLVSRVRFFTEKNSLLRLDNFAKHPILRNRVKTVVYEGSLLASRCFHAYRDHFKQDHHGAELAPKPAQNASERAKRFYRRSMEKWEVDIQQKYDEYKAAYDTQQDLLHSDTFKDMFDSLHDFPKLEAVEMTTASRCGHNLSWRYGETYALNCTMPLEMCSFNSIGQLSALIVPKGIPLLNLKSLQVHALSPKFFADEVLMPAITTVFTTLRKIHIVFRLESEDRESIEEGPKEAYSILTKGTFRTALNAAEGLESLHINFDDLGYWGPVASIRDLLGDSTWKYLRKLDLDSLSGDAKDFMQTFERQPALKSLTLTFIYLEDILWPQMLVKMKKLSLTEFIARGLLEDGDGIHATTHIDAEAYASDKIQISMCEMLDDFVTCGMGDDFDFNPLEDVDWEDPDELFDKYGAPGEYSDMDISDLSDECGSSMSDFDSDMEID
ncbi:uncharacterized protein HMPREF1541_05907 [Cyphellophora europaea CBS 101466]|uniref:F-box domain-containing protein n=1 Tax=Cyphellophora europaea (strain CBS 101466) TaxID=1220924 RepID=W2RT33_CYPE1|nr:uncharacterized protein HMPREF1541_05907 [Cyphellophora europaea CBS 101466]ETN39681.1 hypothetical protein HMPREF1541_05907 [Cyphellophora europaea CBS 101466]